MTYPSSRTHTDCDARCTTGALQRLTSLTMHRAGAASDEPFRHRFDCHDPHGLAILRDLIASSLIPGRPDGRLTTVACSGASISA